jgi:hypothetical protein
MVPTRACALLRHMPFLFVRLYTLMPGNATVCTYKNKRFCKWEQSLLSFRN